MGFFKVKYITCSLKLAPSMLGFDFPFHDVTTHVQLYHNILGVWQRSAGGIAAAF
jgi:hypothetical protein